MADSNKIGVLNEVGDLGLGFYPVNESQQEKIKESEKNKEDK